jgi:hypothetical protein
MMMMMVVVVVATVVIVMITGAAAVMEMKQFNSLNNSMVESPPQGTYSVGQDYFAFHSTRDLFPCSEKSDTVPYSEPLEIGPHHHTLFL